jgi:hypothetical protein
MAAAQELTRELDEMKANPVMLIGKFLTAVSLAIVLSAAAYGSTVQLSHAGVRTAAATSSDDPGTNGWG